MIGVSKADQPSREEQAWESVRAWLLAHPEHLRRDEALLADLNLRAAASNVVEFVPSTVARLEAALERETAARKEIEAVAEINFNTQMQIQGVVVDLLNSRNHTDLARRVDESAREPFGLVAGAIALEGPERVPVTWRDLPPGGVDDLLGPTRSHRLSKINGADGLFGDAWASVRSVALIRLKLWYPERNAVLAFGSADPEHYAPGQGAELVDFLARVVERTAERWPVL
jgi:hypothetical protein